MRIVIGFIPNTSSLDEFYFCYSSGVINVYNKHHYLFNFIIYEVESLIVKEIVKGIVKGLSQKIMAEWISVPKGILPKHDVQSLLLESAK